MSVYDKVNTVNINYPKISSLFPLIPMEVSNFKYSRKFATLVTT